LDSLIGISSKDIDIHWPNVLPFIKDALANSLYTPEHILEALRNKNAQLWIALNDKIDAVCVTQITVRPLGNTCGIWICTGTNRTAWQDHIETIEAWAKANGCVAMVHEARNGWQKILKPNGYELTHVILEKRL
jgi:hypothetical protein